jgi:hypothetical protein
MNKIINLLLIGFIQLVTIPVNAVIINANPSVNQYKVNFTNAKGENVNVVVDLPSLASPENTYYISNINPIQEFKVAINKIKIKNQPSKIIFNAQNYNLQENANHAYFMVVGVNDLTIEGQNSNLNLNNVRSAFFVRDSSRISISNFNIKYKIRAATRGTVRIFNGTKGIAVSNETAATIVNQPWHRRVRSVYQASNLLTGPFQFKHGLTKKWGDVKNNPFQHFQYNATQKAYIAYSNETLKDFDVGEPVLIKHSEYDANAIATSNVRNISIRNNRFSNVHGMGIYVAKTDTGVLIDHNTISIDRDDPLSVMGASADGIHINTVRRNIIINRNNVSTTGDDALNIHGRFWEIVDVSASQNKIKIKAGFNNHTFYESCVGEFLELYRNDLSFIDTAVVTNHQRLSNNILELTLNKNLNLEVGSVVNRNEWQPKAVYVNQNTFSDLWGRGALLQCSNGIFTRNRIRNTSGAGIVLQADNEYFKEAGPVRNMIISKNIVDNTAHAVDPSFSNSFYSSDLGAISIVAKISWNIHNTRLSPNHFFHGPYIVLFQNTISNSPGPAVMASSAHGVRVLQNNISNSNYLAQSQSQAGFHSGLVTNNQSIFTKNIANFFEHSN